MGKAKKTRIYCSGPLFSPEERTAMQNIADILENHGFETFLPQRDGLESLALSLGHTHGARSRVLNPATTFLQKAIFSVDIFQVVEGCDALVCNINGRVPDEGATVELAVAFSVGKPLVIYKNDERTVFSGFDNPMLIGLSPSFSVTKNIDDIPAAIRAALDESPEKSLYSGRNIPPNVRKTLRRGREIWRLLKMLRRSESKLDASAILSKLSTFF